MRGGLPPYPTGDTGKVATPVAAASGNVAAAAATAVLAAGGANVMTYISGFEFTGAGATGASVVALTITGVLGGTLTYNIPVPVGAAVGIPPLVVEFNPPLQASALNQAITVSVASLGAGNTNSAVVAHGFQVPYSS
ncbi:MAG TPA: hypothetical protein VF901_21895 [Bradyrhizobium sp.]